jgi:chemotaxis protein methyltransferase CheR
MKPLSNKAFDAVTRLFHKVSGIQLAESKHALVTGRLQRLASEAGEADIEVYVDKLLRGGAPAQEMTRLIDRLTTNETYFFREIKHFEFLRTQALAARARVQPFRVWSAASSSGEEAYSIAMVLADCMESTPWEVLGTDISTHVLKGAAKALYTMERARHIPPDYLRRFCLKGSGEHHGKLLIERKLRSHVLFRQVNLNAPLPNLGQFDLVFLRNVMIYFSDDTKREVVARVISTLKPGGFFCVGHSESLNNISNAVESVAPSIYRKAG